MSIENTQDYMGGELEKIVFYYLNKTNTDAELHNEKCNIVTIKQNFLKY